MNSNEFFGEVISTYTREQAIEDGQLIDVSETAREAGFKYSVVLTAAAWADCVAWSDDDNEQQAYQDESGRLWDVLFLAFHGIQTNKDSGTQLLYQLYRVPRDGHSTEAVLVTLKLIIGPGDTPDPVITILLPNED
jgi:hypothetical protein